MDGARAPFALVVEVSRAGNHPAPFAHFRVIDKLAIIPFNDDAQQDYLTDPLAGEPSASGNDASSPDEAARVISEGYIEMAVVLDENFVDICCEGDGQVAIERAASIMAEVETVIPVAFPWGPGKARQRKGLLSVNNAGSMTF